MAGRFGGAGYREKAPASPHFKNRRWVERFFNAALDQPSQRDIKEFGNVAAVNVGRRAEAKLKQGIARRANDCAGSVECDRAFAERANEFGAAMKAYQAFVTELILEHAVFNHLHRHVDQCKNVLTVAARFAGGVQYCNDIATVIENGGCR